MVYIIWDLTVPKEIKDHDQILTGDCISKKVLAALPRPEEEFTKK